MADSHPSTTITLDAQKIGFTSGGQTGGTLRGFNMRVLGSGDEDSYNLAQQGGDDAGFYQAVYDADHRFGPDEIAAMKSWGANVLRFKAVQYYLAKNDATYVKCFTNAVRMARNAGFLVILAMQTEKNPKVGDEGLGLPSSVTKTAWTNTDAIFAGDPGIMYEIFNEPHPSIYTDDTRTTLSSDASHLWDVWLNGGVSNDSTYIGHQNLVTWMRNKLQTSKVLIVDSLDLDDSFEGMIPQNGTAPINDPQSRIAYAIHPYPRNAIQPTSADQYAEWDKKWGYLEKLATRVPVIVTEWVEGGTDLGGAPAVRAADLVNYVNGSTPNNSYKIPLITSVFDSGGVMVQNLEPTTEPQPWVPTNFDSYDPPNGAMGAHPGILICRFFLKGYRPDFSYTGDYLKTPLVAGESSTSPCQETEPN